MAALSERMIVALDGAAGDDYKSEAFIVPEWADYTAVFIPAIVDGAVSLEWIDILNTTAAKVLPSADTDWHPVGDPTDGADAVICASGNDPMIVDISLFVRGLAGTGYVRIITAGQQTAKVYFTIHCVGG